MGDIQNYTCLSRSRMKCQQSGFFFLQDAVRKQSKYSQGELKTSGWKQVCTWFSNNKTSFIFFSFSLKKKKLYQNIISTTKQCWCCSQRTLLPLQTLLKHSHPSYYGSNFATNQVIKKTPHCPFFFFSNSWSANQHKIQEVSEVKGKLPQFSIS